MVAWLEEIAGPGFASAVLWTLLALILLVIVLVIIRLVRGLTFGTFVAGGRNRKTRLAVMDAAAVDSHRRLVLVRRDDVEHLILIGGPTDVVVEQNIRVGVPQQRRPTSSDVPALDTRPRQPAPNTQQVMPLQQRAAEPRATEQAPRTPEPAPRAVPAPPPAPIRQPASAAIPVRPADPRTPPPILPAAALAASPVSANSANAGTPVQAKPKPPELSLEDEMNKLLGELSSAKRK